MNCSKCHGRGWFPEWVEDDACAEGGYEGRERYCTCKIGKILRANDILPIKPFCRLCAAKDGTITKLEKRVARALTLLEPYVADADRLHKDGHWNDCGMSYKGVLNIRNVLTGKEK